MKTEQERDKDWLESIDKLLSEITNLSQEVLQTNSRRNMMRKQLVILRARMGYGKEVMNAHKISQT